MWLDRLDAPGAERRLIRGGTEEIVEGVTAVKAGGHFDGSLVLHWEDKLFIADTLVTVPVSDYLETGAVLADGLQSAYYQVDRQPGTTSYAFMWAIPNFIPLPPDEIMKIWRALRPFEFATTHGAFMGMDVRDKRVKERVLESMKIQIRAEGYKSHELLDESC